MVEVFQRDGIERGIIISKKNRGEVYFNRILVSRGFWRNVGNSRISTVRERLRGNCKICKMKLNRSVVGRKNLRKEKSKFCKILIVEEL